MTIHKARDTIFSPSPHQEGRRLLLKGLGAGLGFTTLVPTLLHSGPAHAAPSARLWKYWLPQKENATTVIDHTAWTDLLQRRLMVSADGINRVAYDHFSAADHAQLKSYLKMLSQVPVFRLNRKEQLAYWINLYNALTVQKILAHFPVGTIRDIDTSPGFFSDGPWDEKLYELDGQEISLNDIEHRILRPIWKDPRLHYAVNCASLGCPNLQPEAFTGEKAETMLTQAAYSYINHSRGFRFNGDQTIASRIYDWYAEDFDVDGGVVKHLLIYLDPVMRMRLESKGRIDSYAYDWSLNIARHEVSAN